MEECQWTDLGTIYFHTSIVHITLHVVTLCLRPYNDDLRQSS